MDCITSTAKYLGLVLVLLITVCLMLSPLYRTELYLVGNMAQTYT